MYYSAFLSSKKETFLQHVNFISAQNISNQTITIILLNYKTYHFNVVNIIQIFTHYKWSLSVKENITKI